MKSLVIRQEFSNAMRLFLVERVVQKQPEAAEVLSEYVNLLSVLELAKIYNKQGLVYKECVVMEGRMEDLTALRGRIVKGAKDKSKAGMARVRGWIAREKTMRKSIIASIDKKLIGYRVKLRSLQLNPKGMLVKNIPAAKAKAWAQIKKLKAQRVVVTNPKIALAVAGVSAVGVGYKVTKEQMVMEGRMEDLKALRIRIVKGAKDKSKAGMASVRKMITREKTMRKEFIASIDKKLRGYKVKLRSLQFNPKSMIVKNIPVAKAKVWSQIKALKAQRAVVTNPKISLAIAGIGAVGVGYTVTK